MLDAARAGDRHALEVLVTAHYDRVHALCRRMLGNDADALDATQDTLVSAIRALSRFDSRSSFATWIYRIATNTCLDEIRRRRRRPVVGFAADIGGGGSGGGAGVGGAGVDGAGAGSASAGGVEDRWSMRGTGGSGGSGDPGDIVAARVDIDTALASVPVEFRTAVVLRDVCDLPYGEISEILGVPVGTVRSRIARARSALAATWPTELSEHARVAGRTTPDVSGNDLSSSDVRPKENDPVTVKSQKDERTP